MPKYPERAVMSLRQEHGDANWRRALFQHLRDNAGLGRMGEADKSKPGGRLRLFEHSSGLFVVQIRRGLNDCVVPGLSIDQQKGELSFEWRDLFARFFEEKKMAECVLKDAQVGLEVPSRQTEHGADTIQAGEIKHLSLSSEQPDRTPYPVVSGGFSHIKPSLRAIAQSDIETRCRYRWEQEQERSGLRHLRNPVQTWKDIVGSRESDTRMSISRCRVRRNADEEANVEDEGAINEARIDWELESNQVADAARRAEWDKRTEVHTKYTLSWLSSS